MCCVLLQSAVPEEGWDQVHDERLQVLQPGPDHQCGRCRGHREGEREGLEDRVDEHEPELGTELAVERRPGWPVTIVPCHRERPAHFHLVEHRPFQLAVRPDFLGQELQGLVLTRAELQDPQ